MFLGKTIYRPAWLSSFHFGFKNHESVYTACSCLRTPGERWGGRVSLAQSASEQHKWTWVRHSLNLFKKMKKISVVGFWTDDFLLIFQNRKVLTFPWWEMQRERQNTKTMVSLSYWSRFCQAHGAVGGWGRGSQRFLPHPCERESTFLESNLGHTGYSLPTSRNL